MCFCLFIWVFNDLTFILKLPDIDSTIQNKLKCNHNTQSSTFFQVFQVSYRVLPLAFCCAIDDNSISSQIVL